MRATRHIAVERQKDELRRERDHLMLDLARELGPIALAERFGVTSSAMSRLVDEARERLSVRATGRGSGEPEISARRLVTGEARWADADADYEALGRTSG